ncbi:Secretion protein snm4 OS=Tsukamurella paurometabola (strain ATCC 8368 / DSM / CCUG 35730 /CIP 100753 / JCM 10117 / KCTC 9821 / NBRC 16120 / NCIMB 702349/ NCTC 13040) OX=521096 GN=Tpau_0332 PE=3 SV=1 [Tsukamurella paurometabola]|uniref:Secretion protein snm4 n=1 Tax=Tsukamurella paurometabola (strain ATCC 8368 / DSM 20162 / CCUG 35730 / CIP 100753 / JCM 10117 / KCTC 9821 / NBRC 16120 / NCIMB 702349 / NCTC 13040) TaxID=521096 RepID=D5URC2_TSUPD|nr:type VII secretion integral membrane protein EccD [Tsukamurella paurometabola]ADG76975.1 secretion protein snm4 [Tsukamurella paurometabola DSM 20162]SUP42354.1 Type VII secretion system protein eccD1 [Tsukamurella paurometabola]
MAFPTTPGAPGGAPSPHQAGAAPGKPVVPEQVRVLVEVGESSVERSLLARRRLSVVMDSVIPGLEQIFPDHDFSTAGAWTFAREGGTPLSRDKSLADAGVLDGDRLILAETFSNQTFRPLIESTADAIQEFCRQRFRRFTSGTARTLGLIALVLGAAVFAALVLLAWMADSSVLWWFPVAAIGSIAVITAAVSADRQYHSQQVAYALQLAAAPVLFSTGFVLIPPDGGADGAFTAANVLTGAVFTLIGVVILGRSSGLGAAVLAGLGLVSAATVVASALFAYTPLGRPAIPAIGVIGGLLLANWVQGWALMLARVRPDTLPPPGEDIDRSELDVAYHVDTFDDESTTELARGDENTALERKSRTAAKLLTGFYVAVAAILVVSALTILVPDTHYFWGEVVIAALVSVICVLRGRTLDDRVHATVFFIAGFLIAAGLAIVLVGAVGSNLARLTVIVVSAVVLLAFGAGALLLADRVSAEEGLMAKPLSARLMGRIEFGEKTAIFVVVMLALWTTRLFAFLRELDLSFLK